MNLSQHGGNCCGVRHLWGFGGPTSRVFNGYSSRTGKPRYTTFLTQFKKKLAEVGPNTENNRGKLVEVILTDGQITSSPRWIKELKDRDFRLVSRFHNSTGGWCNVFHKCTGNCRDDKVPDWWRDEPVRIMGVR
jgi:hypothetical protein